MSERLRWQSSLARSHCTMTPLGYRDVVPQFQSLVSQQFLLFMFHRFSSTQVYIPAGQESPSFFTKFLFVYSVLTSSFFPFALSMVFNIFVFRCHFPNSYSGSQFLVSLQGPRESFLMQH